MKKKNPWFLFFWIMSFIVIFMIFNTIKQRPQDFELEYSQFKQYIRSGNISKVLVGPEFIRGYFKDSNGIFRKFKTIPMSDPNLIRDM